MASTLLAEEKERGFDDVVNGTWSTGMGGWSAVASLLGDTEAAAVLYEMLEPFAGQIICTQSLVTHTISGSLGRLATTLGRYDEAEAHFAASEEVIKAAGAGFCACNEDLARAELHRAKGDDDQAKHFAGRAVEAAEEHGYASVERRAAALLTDVAG